MNLVEFIGKVRGSTMCEAFGRNGANSYPFFLDCSLNPVGSPAGQWNFVSYCFRCVRNVNP